MSAAHRIIGEGAYGAIVEPALPNVDEHGNPLLFGPDTVSKVMFRTKNYQKTLADVETIREKIPALAMNVTPYRRTYTEQNIATINGMLAHIGSHKERNGVYVVRMPNLGTDMFELPRNIDAINAMHAVVSESTMMKQILKLMRIVKAIWTAGYIHADIREPNVMCNTTTGELTIIDFDWMMPVARLQKKYPVYYYSHPPESMFLLDSVLPIDQYLKSGPTRDVYLDAVYTNSINYMKNNNADEFWSEIRLHGDTRDGYAYNITVNMRALFDYAKDHGPDAALARYRALYYETVDSFGLAVALSTFSEVFFENNETRDFLFHLLQDMTSPISETRLKIEPAITRMESFIRKKYPEIALGEEVSFSSEMRRMGALVDLLSEKRRASSERRTLRQQVEGLALMTKYMEGLSSPKMPSLPPSPASSNSLYTGSSNSSSRISSWRNLPVRQTRRNWKQLPVAKQRKTRKSSASHPLVRHSVKYKDENNYKETHH
jgi:hypothetical protein